MRKILITGGRGFLSSRFAARYNHRFDIYSKSREQMDICYEEKVFNIFEQCRPDIVFHSASITATKFCNDFPEIAQKVNVEGTCNIAKACEKYKSKLVFLSTEQIFNGNLETGPYSENDIPLPDTVYGKTKLKAEKNIYNYVDEVWIVRLAWMFGMPQYKCGMSSNILWDTVKSIIKNESINVSPNEYRSFTYVEDVLLGLIKLLDIPYGLYNFAALNELNRYEVVQHIFSEMGQSHRMEELLVCDNKKYKDFKRDARLNASKANMFGIHFDDTNTSISRCIHDYDLKL